MVYSPQASVTEISQPQKAILESESLRSILDFDFTKRYEISQTGTIDAFKGKFIKPSAQEFERMKQVGKFDLAHRAKLFKDKSKKAALEPLYEMLRMKVAREQNKVEFGEKHISIQQVERKQVPYTIVMK